MSKFEEILVTLRDCIQKSEEFNNIDVYYDDSQMNSNCKLPAISFKVGTKTRTRQSVDCREYERQIEIRLHTIELDKVKLQSQLYDFEEQLIILIDDAKMSHEFNSFDIYETKSSGIGALVYNARSEGKEYDKTFFSNILRVYFNVVYEF